MLRRTVLTCGLALAGLVPLAAAVPAAAQPPARGTGGAAATVDRLATRAAVDALRRGADAVDATVAAAAVLGVVEPYFCGIGGGGFMVIYRAQDGRVRTIDSRETAPAAFAPTSLLDPATQQPIPFGEAVTSGLSVGVPGTVRGWQLALRRYGSWSLRRALAPAIAVARRGFAVDAGFAAQTRANLDRFRAFSSTRRLFLEPDGSELDPGDVLRNPDLAATYRRLARRGARAFYEGSIARAIVAAVRRPPLAPGATVNARPGLLSVGDLADYAARRRRPARVRYRGLDVYGMAPPSSGGATLGEILNILEGFDLRAGSRADALHRLLEASRLAFADRAAFVADRDFFAVPLAGLLSDRFAAERRRLIGERAGPTRDPGDPYRFEPDRHATAAPGAATVERSGSTTHLTVADRDGDVVAYTFTIEQVGGSGIVVPGHGFLLNNELTDFDFVPGGANAAAPGKRPRSSMAPTLVLRNRRPLLALGSPGGAAIITTVAQLLLDRLDRGATLPEAIAAPRLSQRNAAATQAEPAFLHTPEAAALRDRGHSFAVPSSPEIGAVTAIEFLGRGQLLAAAEPTRRGGGAADVVRRPPRPHRE